MALTSIPEKTEGSLGILKSDNVPEGVTLDPRHYTTAAQLERIKDAIIALATDVGVDVAPAEGSIKARLDALSDDIESIGAGDVLWEWNRANVSQFRVAFDAIGGGGATLSVVMRPHGPVLRVTFPTKTTGEVSTFITLVNPGISKDANDAYRYEFEFRVCGFSGVAAEWYALGPAYLCNQLTGASFYGYAVGASSGGVGGNNRYGRIQAGVQALSGATPQWAAQAALAAGSGGEIDTLFASKFTGRHVAGNNPGWLGTFYGRTANGNSAVSVVGGVNDAYMVSQLGAFGAGWASQTLDTCGIWILGRTGTTANQYIDFDLLRVRRIG